MTIGMNDLAQARETVGGLLEALGLEAYLFEVEPREGNWELRIECACEDGWEATTIPISGRELADCRDDPASRERLLNEWHQRLAACKRRGSPSG